MKKVLGVIIIVYSASLITATGVRANNGAVDVDFGSCQSVLNIPGDVAHYDQGNHQIAGGTLMSGSDNVFSISGGNFRQCFCPASGSNGIQTNFLKTDQPVEGWMFLNGSQWGLSDHNYAAQNSSFNCQPQTQVTPTPFPAPQPCNGCSGPPTAPVCNSQQLLPPTNFTVIRTPTSAKLSWNKVDNADHYSIVYGTKPDVYEFGVVNTGNTNNFTVGSLDPKQKYYFAIYSVNNCMPSNITTGGQVLGLASTGSAEQIMFSFAAGFVFLLLFAGVSKLIRACENNENIQTIINFTQKLTMDTAFSLHCLLRDGILVYVGPILQPSPPQLCYPALPAPPGIN